jgi:hypothetical protein
MRWCAQMHVWAGELLQMIRRSATCSLQLLHSQQIAGVVIRKQIACTALNPRQKSSTTSSCILSVAASFGKWRHAQRKLVLGTLVTADIAGFCAAAGAAAARSVHACWARSPCCSS